MKKIICAGLLVVLVACTSPEPEANPDGAWVGTITTEGTVTTVVNESGSVWGGVATLVEEASIGVETGADAYMFGGVTGVYATDEHHHPRARSSREPPIATASRSKAPRGRR